MFHKSTLQISTELGVSMRARLAAAPLLVVISILLTCIVHVQSIVQSIELNLNTSIHDFRPDQIPGLYTNLPLRTGSGVCSDAIRIGRAEPLSTSNGVLYVIAHQFIELPINGGGVQQCSSSAVTSSQISTLSSTVLRRDTQVELDDSNVLISAFKLADERFYLAFELGDRICGRVRLSSGSISMWVAPKAIVAANIGDFIINFKPGFKYIYYFSDSDQACLYQGDANQIGQVTTAATIPPSVSPSVSPSLSSPSPISSISPIDNTNTLPQNDIPLDEPIDNDDSFFDDGTQNNERVCFPADTMLTLKNGNKIRIDKIEIGDEVMVNEKNGTIEYSQIIGFTHRRKWVLTEFIQLIMNDDKKLESSKGHYLLIDGMVKKAKDVKIGDMIWEINVGKRSIKEIRRVKKIGLYNPQTYDGRIVVNDMIATTYTEAAGLMTTGHALLTPLRWMQRMILK